MTSTLPANYSAMLDAATRLVPTPAPEATILARAAEVLIRDGWCQGEGTDPHGRRCLLNALAWASVGVDSNRAHALDLSAREYIHDVLEARYPDFDGQIDHWNDQPTTSLDDVLDVLAAGRALLGGCSAAVDAS